MTKHLPLVGFVCFASFTVVGSAHAEDKKYSMADLKALVEQKSYREVIQHLGDIAPSERKTEWTEYAGTAAAGVVSSATRDEKLQYMLQIEAQFPQVLKWPKYASVRGDSAREAFDTCFDNRYAFQECRDQALKFVDADPKNAKVTLEVAKSVRHGMAAYGAVPFFKRALAAAAKPAAICKDEDFQLAVVAGLGVGKDDSRLEEAIAMTYTCWDDVKAPLIKELTTESGSFHDRACDLFASKKTQLPADKEKLCAAPRKKK
jgi:hypothetical protein